jgi:hypothetical protein
MKEKALYSIMALVLVLGMALTLATPVGAATPTFTGNVTVDFTGPGILTIPDPGGLGDVTMPANATANATSGWNMIDFRLTYNATTDTLYVGINTAMIAGDADGDGNPGGTSAWLADEGGTDFPNLGASECISVYFNPDQDTDYDAIVGVQSGNDTTGFQVATWGTDASHFGTNITGNHPGSTYFASPNATAPHWEFTVTNFTGLPGQDALLAGLNVSAFMGSLDDNGIGEDFIFYNQSPSTNTTITSSAPMVVAGGSVNLTVSEYNAGNVPLTGVEVEVLQDSTILDNLDYGDGPSGDNGNGILDIGETWIWTNVPSNPISANTTFNATGSAIAPGDFLVTYPDDPGERDQVTVNSIAPNTTTSIAASAATVMYGGSVTLNVTEQNTGDDPLTNPYVEVRQDGTLIATLNSTSPNFSGDNGNGILDTTETWKWTNVPSNAITGTTTFEAKGFGTDSLGNPVSYPTYSSERATVGVNTIAPNTTTTITASATTVMYGGSVTLNVTEQNTGDDPLTNPYVEVRQDGTLIATLNSTSPNFSGDNGNGILDTTETWKWTNVPSNAITGTTTFEAKGFGTDSLGNPVSYPTYSSERATVGVNTIQPNTVTTITASAAIVDVGNSVSLNVTEHNSGGDPLTNPYVEVRQGGTLIATLNSTSPNFSGDNGNGILDTTETWTWTNVTSNPITAATMFEAKGFGTDSLGNPVSYPTYPSERATVTVNVRGEGCLEICKFEDANVNGMWDPGEPWLPDWKFHVTGPAGYDTWVTTGPDGCIVLLDLVSGTYTVTEELKAGWYNTRPGGDPPYDQPVTVGISMECARVEFGNREEIKDIPPMVPTMNKWGIIAMIALFTGLLVWTVRRKRLSSRMS